MDRRCLRLRRIAAERLRIVRRLRGRWEVWLTVERLRRHRGNVGDRRGGAGQPVMKVRIHGEEFDLVRENSDRVLEVPYQRLRCVRSMSDMSTRGTNLLAPRRLCLPCHGILLHVQDFCPHFTQDILVHGRGLLRVGGYKRL